MAHSLLRRKLSSLAIGVIRNCALALRVPALPFRLNHEWIRIPTCAWESWRATYEPEIAAVLQAKLSPSCVFVDVGAHIGLWSIYASKVMKGQGRVLAFEPSPVFDVLAKTARLYPTITPRRAGIGSQNSSLTFYAQGHATIGSFVRDVTAMTGQVAITEHRVPVNPLDEALEGLYPDLVKVDVEGFELEVLRGASKTIKSGCDWLIEIHPYQLRLSGGSEREVRRVLSDYTIETIGERGNGIYTIVATPKRC